MKRLEESGTGGGRRWKVYRIKFIPETHGVYILYKNGRKVFISQTENLKKQIEKDKTSICFDEVTWYRAEPEYATGLVKRLKRVYCNELEGT